MSRAELERIKASVLPSIENNSKLERKRALKAKSDERLKNWPNTLEALRIKKESFIKDREAEEEAKRQEIDREVSSSFHCTRKDKSSYSSLHYRIYRKRKLDVWLVWKQ